MMGCYGRPKAPPIFGTADTAHRDRGELAKPVTTPNGERFEAVVARVHTETDGLVYPEGVELRDRDELSKIVAQLVGKPVVFGHPDRMISQGAKPKIIGRVISARLDGDNAIGVLEIDDVNVRAAIRAGIRQISLGYFATLDKTRHQRSTKIDHVSIEKIGRCTGPGGTCSIRTDSAFRAHRDCGDDHACSCASGLPPRFDSSSPDAARLLELARAVEHAQRRDAAPKVTDDDLTAMIRQVEHLDGSYPFSMRSAMHPLFASMLLTRAVERAERKYQAAIAKRDALSKES